MRGYTFIAILASGTMFSANVLAYDCIRTEIEGGGYTLFCPDGTYDVEYLDDEGDFQYETEYTGYRYTYDSRGNMIKQEAFYKDEGDKSPLTNLWGTYDWVYDENNRVISVAECNNGPDECSETNHTYDNEGNRYTERHDAHGDVSYYLNDNQIDVEGYDPDTFYSPEYGMANSYYLSNGEEIYAFYDEDTSEITGYGKKNENGEIVFYSTMKDAVFNIQNTPKEEPDENIDLGKKTKQLKRIYTVEEAAAVTKPTGNTFKIRYK